MPKNKVILKNESAVTMVETALLLPVYLGAFFAIFELFRFMLTAALVDYSLSKAGAQTFQLATQSTPSSNQLLTTAQTVLQQNSFNFFNVVLGAPGAGQVGLTSAQVNFGGGYYGYSIQATYAYTLSIPLLATLFGVPQFNLRSSTIVPVVQ